MSHSSEEFERHAKAERQLCDEAAPVLAEVIRDIAVHSGLCIAEIRVTVDWVNRSNGAVAATCTIVRAHPLPADGDGPQRAVRSTESPGGGLSSSHGRIGAT
jgi:hypothetical protein